MVGKGWIIVGDGHTFPSYPRTGIGSDKHLCLSPSGMGWSLFQLAQKLDSGASVEVALTSLGRASFLHNKIPSLQRQSKGIRRSRNHNPSLPRNPVSSSCPNTRPLSKIPSTLRKRKPRKTGSQDAQRVVGILAASIHAHAGRKFLFATSLARPRSSIHLKCFSLASSHQSRHCPSSFNHWR